jgi:hypothetical protein
MEPLCQIDRADLGRITKGDLLRERMRPMLACVRQRFWPPGFIAGLFVRLVRQAGA